MEIQSPMGSWGEYCLDTSQGDLMLQKCNAEPSQEFEINGPFIQSHGGSAQAGLTAGKCIDVTNGYAANGVALRMNHCNRSAAQRFDNKL